MTILKRITHNVLMAAMVAAIAICGTLVAAAQDSGDTGVARPVASMFMLDAGYGSVRDTYLTPVTYGGTNLRLGYQAMQATGFNPDKWVRNLEVGVEYGNVHNPMGNNTMHTVMVDGRWSLVRRWRDVFTPGLQLMAGGAVMARGGVIYNGANSNNICSVKIHAGIGLAGTAVYPVRVGRLPVTLVYQMSMPVLGAFYSPEYDESYYEIYVGNHKGLAHFTLGKRFEINHQLNADVHLGNTILRIGYRYHNESSDVSNLKTNMSSHSVVLGIGGDFLSIGRKKTPSRTISSIY